MYPSRSSRSWIMRTCDGESSTIRILVSLSKDRLSRDYSAQRGSTSAARLSTASAHLFASAIVLIQKMLCAVPHPLPAGNPVSGGPPPPRFRSFLSLPPLAFPRVESLPSFV